MGESSGELTNVQFII